VKRYQSALKIDFFNQPMYKHGFKKEQLHDPNIHTYYGPAAVWDNPK